MTEKTSQSQEQNPANDHTFGYSKVADVEGKTGTKSCDIHARETDSQKDAKSACTTSSALLRPATIENAKETFWIGAQQNFCKILNEPLCDRILTSSLEQLRAETIKEIDLWWDKQGTYGRYMSFEEWSKLKQELEAMQ